MYLMSVSYLLDHLLHSFGVMGTSVLTSDDISVNNLKKKKNFFVTFMSVISEKVMFVEPANDHQPSKSTKMMRSSFLR